MELNVFNVLIMCLLNVAFGIPLNRTIFSEQSGNFISGRAVSVSAKAYRQSFKDTLSLGQCPLISISDRNVKTCTAQFTGDEILIPSGAMNVDVHRVESAEDILRTISVGVGTSVGVLGLASISPKIKTTVNTEVSKKNLNLLSGYEMRTGVKTLYNPRPKGNVPDSTLFLSEIELGGNEMMIVTLEFESAAKKVEVQITITFKILIFSFTAKLNFLHKTMKIKAKVRIQFMSSWRTDLDEYYSDLENALPRVEAIEEMYMKGPEELRKLSPDQEKLHNVYHFSSWKESPYGKHFNQALINHDIDTLIEQYTEMQSVVERIDSLNKRMFWSKDQQSQLNSLSGKLSEKTKELTKGLNNYHKMSANERQSLRDLYGQDKPPLYYTRELNAIIGE